LICYWIYYAVWSSAAHRNTTPSPAPRKLQPLGPVPASAAVGGLPNSVQPAPARPVTSEELAATPQISKSDRRRARVSWRDHVGKDLAAKPLREKVSELVGSMLLAAMFSALSAGFVFLFLAKLPASEQWATYLWLASVGTLGSWTVLIPAKFAEGKLEDQVPMRLTLLSLGAVVGLFGWFMSDLLLMKSPGFVEPVDVGRGLVTHEMLGYAEGTGNIPGPISFVAYFAFLFLIMRWWRQAEFTRSSRMSLWNVIICVATAWILHTFWWFPQPTGMMAAGVIAVAVQLASPWMPPSRRRAISEQLGQPIA